MLSYPAQRPGTSPSISIPSKTPRPEASKSISLTNMNSVRAIQSAACAASQSRSIGSNKLETISQNKVPYTYRTVAHNRANRRKNQPALPGSLQRRRIGICPQRPVWSAAYTWFLLLLMIDFVDCACSHGLPKPGYNWYVNDSHH